MMIGAMGDFFSFAVCEVGKRTGKGQTDSQQAHQQHPPEDYEQTPVDDELPF